MAEHNKRLNEYASKAKEEDISKIESKLGNMNRGPIGKAWANVQALWAMVKDPNAAWASRAIAIGALIYLVSPIDAIPDIIPVLGLTDDAGVIAAAVATLAVQLSKYKNK